VTSAVPDVGALLRALLFEYERYGAQLRRELGVSANEELVLLFLSQGVSAPTRLSEVVGMTTAGMTHLLDRLEAEGLVRRERHATDGRRVLVTLTKRGFRLHMQFEAMQARLTEAACGLGADGAAGVEQFLVRATDVLRGGSDL
jgi:DNA-binding MarR family transcriptional regulator